MAFSFDRFYQINRRALIWLVFFLLLWLLRDFFGLIFLTFVLAFIAAPLIQYGQRRLRLPRRVSIVVVYLFFLLTIAAVITFLMPRVGREVTVMVTNLPKLESRLLEVKNNVVRDYPQLEDALPGFVISALGEGDERGASKNYREEYLIKLEALRHNMGLTEADILMREEAPTTDTQRTALFRAYNNQRDELLIRTFLAQQLDLASERAPQAINLLYRMSVTLLLALLFSFLIMMDITRLGEEVKSLGSSRVGDFYNQTAQPVVRFAYVVGRAIRAQASIAVVNTLLTVIGLYVLGIPSLIMLSFIVFFCSFIPVLGVFISTVPIVLVALNAGGPGKAIASIAMVIIIHAIEAYLLNPLIYGQHFKINPVIVLMILFIGHHAFGLWGMILGVPVAYYFLHDVFGVKVWDDRKLSSSREGPAPLSAMPRTDPSTDIPAGEAAQAIRTKTTTP